MTSRLPATFKKLSVVKISHRFREAVKLVDNNLPALGPGEVLVKNRYLGINASDINYTSARYDSSLKPPFDCGFEAVGQVVSTGDQCKLNRGQSVAYIKYGAFSEYTVVPEKLALPVPQPKPEYVPLLVSGLTAHISLHKVGEIKKGETVLVTAAAGGTGQFAVQIAKNAGCHVIGTCSNDAKMEFLRSIGCDRPVNYKTESLRKVLKEEYPKGVDVVYETIGGEMFDTCVDAIAVKGRLISIGFIEGYETPLGLPKSKKASLLPVLMLRKSASIRGFFLFHYTSDWAPSLAKLVEMLEKGEIQSVYDSGKHTEGGPLTGMDSIERAVEYLYTKNSIGKIVVELPEVPTSQL